MGVDLHVLSFLLENGRKPYGHTLTLGRQEVHISPTDPRLGVVARANNWNVDDLTRAISSNHYADDLLQSLGCGPLAAMDISTFEGAEIIHDLNLPVDDTFENKFDFILDGGTLEHVFNFPEAIRNVKKMLRVGGMFIFINGANNMLGHGLYQFGPELLWRLFKQEDGFEVLLMRIVDTTEVLRWAEAPDPQSLGYRNEVSTTAGPAYIMMSARKVGTSSGGSVYQSDYVSQWRKQD